MRWGRSRGRDRKVDHAAFYRDQGTLDQAQGALGDGVEHLVGVAGAAAEVRTVGLAQVAVVVQASLFPAMGGDGELPTQIVHAPTPLGLLDAFFLADALQPLAFAGGCARDRRRCHRFRAKFSHREKYNKTIKILAKGMARPKGIGCQGNTCLRLRAKRRIEA